MTRQFVFSRVTVPMRLVLSRAIALRRLVEAAGCQVRFLPASSPDLSPIEEAFSKCKTLLRRAEARTVEALEAAIGPAREAITPQDARHYCAHCGYGIVKQS